MERFILIGLLATQILASACATSSLEFRPVPNEGVAPAPTQPDQIEIVEFEDLDTPFTIVGEYVVNLERSYNDERPDLFKEGVARIKAKAAEEGSEALLMVVQASRVEERAPYKQPFGGLYNLRMQVRALGIVMQGRELARADQNRDGRPDLWAYIEGGRKFFEFFDDDYDGKADRMRRYIYDPQAHPKVELDYVPEADLNPEGSTARQETSIQIISEIGLWTEYVDTDHDGLIDFESSLYSRASGAPIVIETKYP